MLDGRHDSKISLLAFACKISPPSGTGKTLREKFPLKHRRLQVLDLGQDTNYD